MDIEIKNTLQRFLNLCDDKYNATRVHGNSLNHERDIIHFEPAVGGSLLHHITEEGFATAKGAVIGQTTREEIQAIYGEPESSMGAADRYELGDILVSFIFSGGILSEIDYNNTK